MSAKGHAHQARPTCPACVSGPQPCCLILGSLFGVFRFESGVPVSGQHSLPGLRAEGSASCLAMFGVPGNANEISGVLSVGSQAPLPP